MLRSIVSRIWYTSDLHFGHQRVSDIRNYTDTKFHDEAIMFEWDRIVKPKDVVYVLGDIAVSNYNHAFDILKALPGRKHLISGNHDIVHPMHTKGHSRGEQMKWLGVFETVQPFLRRKFNHQTLLLSHFPYAEWGDGESREGSRYDEYRLPNLGLPLLHGHTHGAEQAHGNMMHVGWDAWGTLVPQEIVLDWLSTLE